MHGVKIHSNLCIKLRASCGDGYKQLNEKKSLCLKVQREKPRVNMIYQKNRFSPQNKTSASLKLLTTASTLALVGCGGGSGGSSFFVPGSGSSIGSSGSGG